MKNSKPNQKLEIGDIVQLKSGGPKMTIQFIDKRGDSIKCQWFAGEKFDKLEACYFSPDSLKEMVEDKEKELNLTKEDLLY